MNDRYLYRAKRKNNGEWVEGDLVHSVYKINDTCVGKYGSNDGMHQVDESTVCQCTGLKDKNGKSIWENDIIKEFNSQGDEWNLSKVVFADYSLNIGWCIEGIKTLHQYNRRLFNVGLDLDRAKKSEVIGNIFDNPELLEVGE